MTALLVVLFFSQFGILLFLYISDRRLKHVLKSGIKPVKMLALTKSKYFFVFYKRKDGLITKHAYSCMIAYYMINSAGFATIITQIIVGSSLPLATCCILAFSHVGLITAINSQPVLSYEQKKMLERYLGRERDRQCEKMADERAEQILSAIINKDNGALKSLFSKKALNEAEDIDTRIDGLFSFIQGDIGSWERGLVPFDESRKYLKKRILIRFTVEISTDKEKYQLFAVDFITDKINPANKGVYMLEIRKSSYDANNLQPWRERICAGITILED